MEEKKKDLHVTRIRAKGEPTFFDPSADVRQIMAAVINISSGYLKTVYAKEKEALEAFDYLYRCFKIFQIRLAEDTAPVFEQVAEYEKALRKVEPRWYQIWRDTVQSLMTGTYALFVRRDAKVDEEEMRKMLNYVQLPLLKSFLSADTFNKVKSELESAEAIARRESYEVGDGMAVEAETGQVIQNIKSVVGMFIGSADDMSWPEAAEVCDRIFNERVAAGCEDKRELVALALAYPSYEHNQLSIKIEDDGHQGETEKA